MIALVQHNRLINNLAKLLKNALLVVAMTAPKN